MRLMRFQPSLLTVSVLLGCVIFHQAQAWRGAASGSAVDGLIPPNYVLKRGSRQQHVRIAAKLTPGPEYRAFREEDDVEDSYKQHSKYQQKQPPGPKAQEPDGGQADSPEAGYPGLDQYQYQESQYGDLNKQHTDSSETRDDFQSRYPSNAEERRRYADDLQPGYKKQNAYQPDEHRYRPHEQPKYDAPMQQRPELDDKPDDERPAHDNPPYAQEQHPTYGQPPAYTQPSYGQEPHQPFNEPAAYEQPRDAQDQPYGEPPAYPKPYDKPGYNQEQQQPYDQPAAYPKPYDKPSYNEEQQQPYGEPPAYPKPYDKPSYNQEQYQPGHDKPAYGQEQYQPGYDKPSVYDRRHDTPAHGKEAYQPGYEMPPPYPKPHDEQQQPYDQPPAYDKPYDKPKEREEYQPYEPPSGSKMDPGPKQYYSKDTISPEDYDKRGSYDLKDPMYPGDPYNPEDLYGYKDPSYAPSDSYAPKDDPYGKDPYSRDATDASDWDGDGAEEPYSGGEEGSYGRQDSYGQNPYGQDSYDRDSYGGYDAEGSEGYEEVVSHICLQEQARTSWPEAGFDPSKPQYKSTFQCCTPDDAPDACLAGNNTGSPYSYYSKYPSFRSDSLLDTYLTPPTAATCFWSYESTLCPSHLMDTCLGSGTLNCSLSGDAAKSCGSPLKGFQFTASGYFTAAQAFSCEPFYGPSAVGSLRNQWDGAGGSGASARINEDGLFVDVAWVFRGQIKVLKQSYGYTEAKGMVEFVAEFGQAPQGGGDEGRRRLLADGATVGATTAPSAVTAAAQPAQGAAAQPTPAATQSAQGVAAGATPAMPQSAQGAVAGPVVPAKSRKRAKASSWELPDHDLDLPIVKGGSLHIRLYDKWGDSHSDGYGY